MSGEYRLHIHPDAIALALDEDGGCDIADYALSHGVAAAVDAFLLWLSDRVKEQAVAREAERRRSAMKMVRGARK